MKPKIFSREKLRCGSQTNMQSKILVYLTQFHYSHSFNALTLKHFTDYPSWNGFDNSHFTKVSKLKHIEPTFSLYIKCFTHVFFKQIYT
jgi:hypothetical protein